MSIVVGTLRPGFAIIATDSRLSAGPGRAHVPPRETVKYAGHPALPLAVGHAGVAPRVGGSPPPFGMTVGAIKDPRLPSAASALTQVYEPWAKSLADADESRHPGAGKDSNVAVMLASFVDGRAHLAHVRWGGSPQALKMAEVGGSLFFCPSEDLYPFVGDRMTALPHDVGAETLGELVRAVVTDAITMGHPTVGLPVVVLVVDTSGARVLPSPRA